MREPLRDIDITDDQPGPRKDAPLFGPGLASFLGLLIAGAIVYCLLHWCGREATALISGAFVIGAFVTLGLIRIHTGSWP